MDAYLRGWHRLGEGFKRVWHGSPFAVYEETDADVTILEAHEKAGMGGLLVEKIPVAAVPDEGPIHHLQNQYCLAITAPYLPETHYTSRLVKQRYEPIQLDTMAEMLEGLQKHWPLAGTMILKDGEIAIVQLQIDDFLVGNHDGERTYSFLTVANDLITGGVMWLRTNVRAQCWNTYSLSLQSLDKMRIPHTTDTETILSFLAAVEEGTVREQRQHQVDLNELFVRPIDDKEFDELNALAFPYPQKTSKMRLAEVPAAKSVDSKLAADFFELVEADKDVVDWKRQRTDNIRKAVRFAYDEFNEAQPYAAATAYGFFQAVTNTVNYSDLFKGSNEKQQISLLKGQKQKMQADAWGAVKALITE